MKYYIQRQLNEYGPYTLTDLQRYIAQGSILLTDLARSEGMTDWLPLSQVIGDIPVQAPSPVMPAAAAVPATGVYAGGTVYSGAAVSPQANSGYPIPPDLHWALVLLIGWFCGIFPYIWLFVQAGFVRKLNRDSNFMVLLIASMCALVVGIFGLLWVVVESVNRGEPPPILFVFCLVLLAGSVLLIVGVFQMRSA